MTPMSKIKEFEAGSDTYVELVVDLVPAGLQSPPGSNDE